MTAKMEDVARRAGVSTATVSRALNTPELVSEATHRRVMDAIHDLDYKINQAARRLRTNQTRTIAIVIPTLADPTINQQVEAIEDVAIDEQYTLLICSTRGDTEREQNYIHLLTQQMVVDGVLYMSPRAAPQQVRQLAEGVAPLVLCNYQLPDRPTPSVLIDHVSSLYQTTRHLLDLGHTRIALLNLAAPYYYPARMRREGFDRAFAEAGLTPDPALIVEVQRPTYANDAWRGQIHTLLDQPDRPTAIVAFNDEVALQVYAVCRARGLRIPEDVSVTGCDDILTARHVDPPLTTVSIPAYALGQTAMRLLLDMIAHPDAAQESGTPATLTLDVSLIVRGSCAPPAAAWHHP